MSFDQNRYPTSVDEENAKDFLDNALGDTLLRHVNDSYSFDVKATVACAITFAAIYKAPK